MPRARLRPLKASSGFPDPVCFGSRGKRFSIGNDGTFSIGDTVFGFLDPDDVPDANEEVVFEVLPHGFSCSTVADNDAAERAEAAEYDRRRAADADEERLRGEADAVFNSSLHLPFAWVPGHRVVLAGLSERSVGNGLNRSSVIHVMAADSVTIGRLRRKAGQFLCAPHVDAYGSDVSMRRAPGARVTCRACIARCIPLASSGNAT